MRVTWRGLFLTGALSFAASCSSKPLTDDNAAGTPSQSGGTQNGSTTPRPCSAALRQSLSLVDQVSTASVKILSATGDDRTIYVDASVGGIANQDKKPWVYLSLATGQPVAVTDLDALKSTAWDLAFKRSVVRTNSGDSGPGNGGAIRIALGWDQVDRTTLGTKTLPIESWFDQDCKIVLDATNTLITTFGDWSQYDESTHLLSPVDAVYVTAAAHGSLYKVAILDYYSTPAGAQNLNNGGGFYKVRVAPLP